MIVVKWFASISRNTLTGGLSIVKKTVAVVTAVYNRKDTMKRLFESLKTQTSKDFYWLIVDDGSDDNIFDDIQAYRDEADFEIEFFSKENGGKHTALNLAFEKVDSDLFFTVDSDDYLTKDAISTIVCDWKNLKNNDRICSIIYLKGYSQSKVIGEPFQVDHIIANDIDMRERHYVAGDKAEVFRSDLLKKYRFPVYEGEKFQGENYVWWQLAAERDSYYVNRIIYIGEYLNGGLSKSGRCLRISCPRGGMDNSKMGMKTIFPLKKRVKRAILYVCYSKFAGLKAKNAIGNSGFPALATICYLPGVLLYAYWKNTVKR